MHFQIQTFKRPQRAFSLTELVVVIGVIILFIALAIPAVNAISGTRSVASAENNLSAVLARAREEAIAVQQIRGVMFYLDTATDMVGAVIVKPTDLLPANFNYSVNPPNGANRQSVIYLDTVPNHDYLLFPKGVRLRTIFDTWACVGGNASVFTDRYLGFNLIGLNGNASQSRYGGVILFDAMGRITTQPYGFELCGPPNGSPLLPPSGIADLLKYPISINHPVEYRPPFEDTQTFPVSQIGVSFFDRRTFLAALDSSGNPFKDGDSQPIGDGIATASEVDGWIDANGTPVLVSRFTGTLIRGE